MVNRTLASVLTDASGVGERQCEDSDSDSKLEISKSWSILRTSRIVELTNPRGRKFKLPACMTPRRLNKAMLKLNRESISLDLARGFGCMCKRTCPFDKIPLEVLENIRYSIAKCSSECESKEVICNMLLRYPQSNDGFALRTSSTLFELFCWHFGGPVRLLTCTLFYVCLGRFQRASCTQLQRLQKTASVASSLSLWCMGTRAGSNIVNVRKTNFAQHS